jgi:hypothetical protein
MKRAGKSHLTLVHGGKGGIEGPITRLGLEHYLEEPYSIGQLWFWLFAKFLLVVSLLYCYYC